MQRRSLDTVGLKADLVSRLLAALAAEAALNASLNASVAAVLAFCAVVFAGAQTTDFLERQGRRVWKALRSLV